MRSHPTFDAEILCQTESAHAVDQTEVDHLGHAALFWSHVFRLRAEHLRSRGAVNVLAFAESLQKPLVLRDVRHDAQFDLRVVSRNQLASGLGDERFSHAAPFGGAHRDVLQIGFGTCQSPRHGRCLTEGRVHAAVCGVGHLRKLVRISTLELGQCSEFQNQFRQRIVKRQFTQDFFVGRWRP